MLNNREYINKQQEEIENLQNENENLLKDLKIAELYKKLSKAECKLNRYMNHVKMNLGREL